MHLRQESLVIRRSRGSGPFPIPRGVEQDPAGLREGCKSRNLGGYKASDFCGGGGRYGEGGGTDLAEAEELREEEAEFHMERPYWIDGAGERVTEGVSSKERVYGISLVRCKTLVVHLGAIGSMHAVSQ